MESGSWLDGLAMDPQVVGRVESFYSSPTSSVDAEDMKWAGLGDFAALAKSEARGRHLVARRAIGPGQMVWSGEPYAAITSADTARTHCGYCFSPLERVMRCSRCQHLRYCSTDCQRKDWASGGHKEECGMIQSVAPHKPTSTMLLMWRVLIRRIKEEKDGKGLPNFDLIRYLTTHHDSIPEEKKASFGMMAFQIKKSLSAVTPSDITPQEIMCLFSLFACNNFTVSDGQLKPLGIGIFPPAALFNHSCDPNCVIIFEGRLCTARSIRQINQGDELTFNYVEVGDPTEVRRKTLMENFFFHCTCPRCQANQPEVTTNIAPDDQARLKKALRLEDEAREGSKTGDYALALKKYKRSLKIRQPILLLHDPVMGFTLNNLMDICLNLAPQAGEPLFQEALFYCRESLVPFERMYPPGWPLVGLQYMILGKLAFYLKYTEQALAALRQALPILTITHGPEHSILRTLHSMLNEVQAELNYEQAQRSRP